MVSSFGIARNGCITMVSPDFRQGHFMYPLQQGFFCGTAYTNVGSPWLRPCIASDGGSKQSTESGRGNFSPSKSVDKAQLRWRVTRAEAPRRWKITEALKCVEDLQVIDDDRQNDYGYMMIHHDTSRHIDTIYLFEKCLYLSYCIHFLRSACFMKFIGHGMDG